MPSFLMGSRSDLPTRLFRTLSILLFALICPGLVNAQFGATRAAALAEARSLAPKCSVIPDPPSDATLDNQQKYWESIETCLTASSAEQRIAAINGDPKAQAAAALTAVQSQAALQKIAAIQAEIQNQKDFLGWSWGVGFGVGISDHSRIEQASIVNGIVRASHDSSQQARAFLEYHWFPERWQKSFGKVEADSIVRAQGPFVAVSSRDDKVLSGVGAGWMIGFRDKGKSEGFGIALGAILDNDVANLADGFEDGQPPPVGETAVRTKQKSRISYVLFFTRSF